MSSEFWHVVQATRNPAVWVAVGVTIFAFAVFRELAEGMDAQIADATQSDDAELWKAYRQGYAGASVSVLVTGIVGGLIKIMYDAVGVVRAERVEQVAFFRNSLNDIKGAYDKVCRARMMMKAHRSSTTYAAEMQELFSALIQLRNVKRAYLFAANDLDDSFRKKMCDTLETMVTFLNDLVEEFTNKWSTVPLEIRASDEKRHVDVGTELPSAILARKQWKQIRQWDKLSEFINSKEDASNNKESLYDIKFVDKVDLATALLRVGIQHTVDGQTLIYSLSEADELYQKGRIKRERIKSVNTN